MSKQKTHNQKMREGADKADSRIAEIYNQFKKDLSHRESVK